MKYIKNGKFRQIIESPEFKIFIASLLIFGIFAHWVGFNQYTRIATASTLAEDHSLEISEFQNKTSDKSVINGNIYSDKPPLSSIAALPAYVFYSAFFEIESPEIPESLKFLTIFSVSGISGAVTLVALFRINKTLLNIGDRKNIAVCLLAGLGTLIFPYATTFHGTALATALITLSLYYFLISQNKNNPKYYFISSIFAGLSVTASYITLVPSLLILAFSAKNLLLRRDYSALMMQPVGFLVGLIPLIAFNIAIFGHPFDLTIFYTEAGGFSSEQAQGSLINPEFFYLHLSFIVNIFKVLFSPVLGIFPFTPLYILALLGVIMMRNTNRDFFIITLGSFGLTAIGLGFLTFIPNPANFGMRYLLPASTLLIPGIAYLIQESRYHRYPVYLVTPYSILVSFSSLQPWRSPEVDIPVDYPSNFSELLLRLQPFGNEVSYYIMHNLERGFQSPISSYVFGFSQNLDLTLGPYPDRSMLLSKVFNELLVIESNIIWLLAPLIVVASFFYIDRLKGLDKISWAGIIIAGILLTLGSINTTDVYYDNWYQNMDHENITWGKENPSIHFKNPQKNVVAEIDVRSIKEKDYEIKVNEETVQERSIHDREQFTLPISTDKGVDEISFKSEDCHKIGDIIGNDDVRCASLGIYNFNLEELEEKSVYPIRNISQDKEKTTINGDAEFYTFLNGDYSIDLEGRSIGQESQVNITLNNQKTSGFLDISEKILRTPYKEFNGLSKVKISTDCTGECEEIELNELEFNSKEEHPENKLYREGTNFYTQNQNEQYQWTSRNSKIYLYNHQNQVINKKLWIEGRSFAKPRDTLFVLNDEKIGERRIETTVFRELESGERIDNKHEFEVDLEPGENVLEIRPEGDCKVIGSHNNNDDVRCAIYGFKDLYLVE